MLAVLSLEAIGDNSEQMLRQFENFERRFGAGSGEPYHAPPWVKHITGRGSSEFLHGKKDYSRANSVGSRGVYLTFWLESGKLYQVCDRRSWRNVVEYFCHVREDTGEIVELEKEDAEAWLNALSE